VAFLETECGSHTHTLIPGAQTSHMYVQSYPLTQQDNCTEANHPEGEISVIRFPTAAPQNAEVTGVIDILPPTVTPDAVGCHDIGVLPAKDLAAAACLGAFAILDISDPGNPQTLSVVQNPLIELDHSAQLTFDGDVAVIGDEHAGAAGGGGCSTDQRSPVGAMWFYDITDPASPQLQGSYSLPRVPPVDSAEEAERFRCTTHNYEILPMRDGRDVAVSPYYSGGLSIVDFTDPAAPEEQGYYLPQVGGKNPDMWSGYWYRGRTYTNEHASKLGISVFKTDGFGTRQVRDFGPRLNPQTQILP
jgi:LVIVD repeat